MEVIQVKKKTPWLLLLAAIGLLALAILLLVSPEAWVETLLLISTCAILVIYGAVRMLECSRKKEDLKGLFTILITWGIAAALLTLDIRVYGDGETKADQQKQRRKEHGQHVDVQLHRRTLPSIHMWFSLHFYPHCSTVFAMTQQRISNRRIYGLCDNRDNRDDLYDTSAGCHGCLYHGRSSAML